MTHKRKTFLLLTFNSPETADGKRKPERTQMIVILRNAIKHPFK
jgi:hypothetical protein